MGLLKTTVEKFAQEQRDFFESSLTGDDKAKRALVPVVTVAMEPGSGGSSLAEVIAKRLGFDYFNRDIVEGIAKSA